MHEMSWDKVHAKKDLRPLLFNVRQEKTADTQADLGFHGAHVSFRGFVLSWIK